ncbi:MAG TPA: Ni/Fe hydrogenase subunit alpha [Terriglobales bacterium]|nr:Ni/Fe hydrogenase subunit alpha [Terriglobales bacterium]
MQKTTIEPVTRIEGHAKITLLQDKNGNVKDARFHVTQVRGFEKICEGRPFWEMPALMARICGICPVSHLIASAKACDALLAVRIPEAAEKLRRIMHLAQFVQSHALSFFHLSSPDLLLGFDSDPAKRNILGILEANPQMARDGIRLRQWGQQIIEQLGGKRIHPGWIVPGGVSEPLTVERRDNILAGLPEARQIAVRTLAWFKSNMEKYRTEIRVFANFPTMFMALANPDNALALYKGWLRFMDSDGNIVADHIDGSDYRSFIGEAVEDDSYLKSTFYKPLGYPAGTYRVGPLARLNMCKHVGTPLADEEFAEYRELERHTVLSSFYYHYARLIELLFAVERIELLLNDSEILSKHVRAFAGPNNFEGVGGAEAPRGTLIHHYTIDEDGLITSANLVIATGHNNLAINKGVFQVAKQFVKGNKIPEGMLNRVEAVVRAFDPCLSCSTHAVGTMPLHLRLVAEDGTPVDEVYRH